MACFLRTCLLALKITSKPVLRSGVSSREKIFGNEMNRQKNLSSSYFLNQSIKLPSIFRCFLLFYFRLPFFFKFYSSILTFIFFKYFFDYSSFCFLSLRSMYSSSLMSSFIVFKTLYTVL